LSIAHTTQGVLVALADHRTTSIGVDLVEPIHLGCGFVAQWFTSAERRWLSSADQVAVAWGVKEAVYKATNRGEPFRPQSIEVFLTPNGQFAARNLSTGKIMHYVHTWKTPQGETAVLAWTKNND
jgi:phosphopantetheinyl transferase